MPKSLYIHIPFCRAKCAYCDFYSISLHNSLAKEFIYVLNRLIRGLPDTYDTVYIGGGTPTVLDEPLLESLLKDLRPHLANNCELSLEANPESLTEDKLKLLLDNRVNRLSVGLQSFNDEKLLKLGRIHSSKQAVEAVLAADKAGFKNISIDLIFGVWQETVKDWSDELNQAVKLPVKHISAYNLTYEPNTPLGIKLADKQIEPLDDGVTAAMYQLSRKFLAANGFKQYEISNFAKTGYACRHNLAYWDNRQYLGLGPSAYSYIDGQRSRNISDVKKYITAVKGNSPVYEFKEKLSWDKRARETAAFKIRTAEGIDFDWFTKQCGCDFVKLYSGILNRLLTNKLVKYKSYRGKKTGIMLTDKGFLFCDSVSRELV
jgi:oxygen-independent coproporphyrinogen III oxidase